MILADLPGPKIRIGRLAKEPVDLVEGRMTVLTKREGTAYHRCLSTTGGWLRVCLKGILSVSVMGSSAKGDWVMKKEKIREVFPSAEEDALAAKLCVPCPQTLSPSYRLAYRDADLLLRDELRAVRLQLELLKPDLVLKEHAIEETVVVFGGARVLEPELARRRLSEAEAAEGPLDKERERRMSGARRDVANSKYYAEARRFCSLISQAGTDTGGPGWWW